MSSITAPQNPPILAVSVERWCRLRGNLLFYFKSRDHWSEPAGVIVVEDCEVKPDSGCLEATFGLILAFNGGSHLQHLGTYTEAERDSWIAALKSASHRHMRSHLEELKARLNAKMCLESNDSISVIGDNCFCNQLPNYTLHIGTFQILVRLLCAR